MASYNGGKWATAFYNFSCSLIFASIAWCMRKHEVVMPGIAEPEEGCPVMDEEGAPQEFHFAEALHKAFDDERIYLNPRLTINLLAERLGTNRTYLSAYINQQLNVSFFEYVNRDRVVYAKGLLAQPDCTVEGGEAEWVQQPVGLPSRFYLADGNDTRPVPQGIAGRRAA